MHLSTEHPSVTFIQCSGSSANYSLSEIIRTFIPFMTFLKIYYWNLNIPQMSNYFKKSRKL